MELAAAAGCFEAFMGFESFDPANLEQRSNSTTRIGATVDTWHAAGVGVHAGYIIGLPFDGFGCGRQAASDLTEIGVDIASFFASTPLPGTEDHVRAAAAWAIESDDYNQFDSTHFVQAHPILSRAQLAREYRDAYRYFYTWRRLAWSVGTFHRVAGLPTTVRAGMLTQQLYFTYSSCRGQHPMLGGIWRVRGQIRRQAVSDADAARHYLGTVDPPVGMLSTL